MTLNRLKEKRIEIEGQARNKTKTGPSAPYNSIIQYKHTNLLQTVGQAEGLALSSSLSPGQTWTPPRYSSVWPGCCNCRTAESGRASLTPPTHNVSPGWRNDMRGSACNLLTGWQGSMDHSLLSHHASVLYTLNSKCFLGVV